MGGWGGGGNSKFESYNYKNKSGVVAHTYNPRTKEAEAEGLW